MISEQQLLETIQKIIDRKAEEKIIPNDFAKLYEIMSVVRGEMGIEDADEILALGQETRGLLRKMTIEKKVSYGRTLNDFYFKITEHANQQKEQEVP
jgi:hypothetical protein